MFSGLYAYFYQVAEALKGKERGKKLKFRNCFSYGSFLLLQLLSTHHKKVLEQTGSVV